MLDTPQIPWRYILLYGFPSMVNIWRSFHLSCCYWFEFNQRIKVHIQDRRDFGLLAYLAHILFIHFLQICFCYWTCTVLFDLVKIRFSHLNVLVQLFIVQLFMEFMVFLAQALQDLFEYFMDRFVVFRSCLELFLEFFQSE